MAHKETMDDGTIRIDGQIVPTGGSQPTVASVVSYSGNTGLQSTNVEGALDELDNEKAPIVHTHDDRYFTEAEVTTLLAGKSSTSHDHDSRYFTEAEVTTLLAGKAAAVHTHDDRYYTESEIDVKLATILASADLHENSKFDLVQMKTNGPGNQGPITPRLVPIGYGDFWANSPGGGVYVALSADNTVRHDNQGYSFKVEHPAETGMSLDSSVFAVSGGSVVTASVWVYGTGGPRAILNLTTSLPANDPTYFQPPGTTAGVESSGSLKPGASWTKITVSFVVPAGHTKARIMLRSYSDSSNGGAAGTIWWDDSSTSMQVIPPSDVVTGEIKMWPHATAPGGYLICNGGTFSGTTYPGLKALLGDTFGTHSGDNYYLPDFRARSPIGVGGAVPAVGGNNYSLGQKWGHEKLQAHAHSVYDPGHSHSFMGGSHSFLWGLGGNPGQVSVDGTNAYAGGPSGNQLMTSQGYWTGVDHRGTGISIYSNGDGNAQNIHPVLGINFIIKAA